MANELENQGKPSSIYTTHLLLYYKQDKMIHLDKGNSLSPGAHLLMTSECDSHVRADPNALCYAVFLSDASHVCFVLVTYNGCSLLLLGKFYFILMTSNFSINLKVKNLLR